MLAHVCLVVSSERFNMTMFPPNAIITHKRHNSNQELVKVTFDSSLPTANSWYLNKTSQYLADHNICKVFDFF